MVSVKTIAPGKFPCKREGGMWEGEWKVGKRECGKGRGRWERVGRFERSEDEVIFGHLHLNI
jgi:hypothetical protein